jgi:hypothetical protein
LLFGSDWVSFSSSLPWGSSNTIIRATGSNRETDVSVGFPVEVSGFHHGNS